MNRLSDSVVKLAMDGANWATYRDRLKLALDARGMGEHLSSDNVTKSYTDAGTISGNSPAVRWHMNEATVKHLLATSVPDSIFNRVKTVANVKTLWKELKELMEERTKTYTINMERQMYTTRCSNDENVRLHFEKLADMRERLAAAGKDIPDDKYASLLLNSLPSSYHDTTSIIIIAADIGGKNLSPEVVTRLVTDKYDECIAKDQKEQSKRRKRRRENVERHHHQRRRSEPYYNWAVSDNDEEDEPHRGHRARPSAEIWLAEEVLSEDPSAEEVPGRNSRARVVPGQNSVAEEDVASLHTPKSPICFAPSVDRQTQGRLKEAEENATADNGAKDGRTSTQIFAPNVKQELEIEEQYCEDLETDKKGSSFPFADERDCSRNRSVYSRTDNKTSSNDDYVSWKAKEQSVMSNWPREAKERTQNDPEVEIYDSGTTHHFSPHRRRFLTYRSYPPHLASCVGGSTCPIIGIGDLYVKIPNGTSSTRLLLEGVLHAPNLQFTLVSVPCIVAMGHQVTFENDLCKIKNQNKEIVGEIRMSKSCIFRVQHERENARFDRPATLTQPCM